ncbi:uncharacterized protein [Ptychodera flava]|uniref:uncharacterized protein n=1 Tax=Ptychodera flava TaxID=63121 RepID=UPI00396A6834
MSSETKPLRIFVWAHPRSRSTALEFSVNTLPNVKAFHELYCLAYHNGEERPVALDKALPVTGVGLQFRQVKETLEKDYPGNDVIFCKDIAYSLDRDFDRLPKGFQHTFLIRDPRKSIVSWWKACLKEGLKYEDWILEEGGIKHVYDLFKYVTEDLGQPPVILDADELANHPEDTLRAWCPRVGLEFNPGMLHWEAANVSHWLEFHQTAFYRDTFFGQALTSTGFTPTVESDIDWTKVPEFVKGRIRDAVPYYEKMYKLRITKQ